MGNVFKVEEILKEYKYTEIRVEELRIIIKDIQNSTPGALKAICSDSIKISPTYSIAKMIENSVVQKSRIVDELEIKIYSLQRNNRIINKTLAAMGGQYEQLFYYKYINELENKEIARRLNISEMQVGRLLRRLLSRMEKMLLEKEYREVSNDEY